MKFLKGLTLSLLGFLLFLSLSIFSTAFMLNNTFLKPELVVTQVDRLDVAEIAKEAIGTPDSGDKITAAIFNTIPRIEPLVKEQIGIAIYSIYDYLLGEKPDQELALTLKNTVLSSGFIVAVVDELDIPSLVGGIIKEQFTKEIPKDMGFIVDYLEGPVDDTLTELEPWLKEQIGSAADPIVAYMLGESKSLSIAIPLEPVKESLKDNLWQALTESPPPELAQLPQVALKPFYDELYEGLAKQIPSTFEINEEMLGTEMPDEIAVKLAEAELVLEQAREYISRSSSGIRS